MVLYSAGVRYCAGEIVWHNINPSIVAGFYIVRVPGIVRVNLRDTYPHYIGPPTAVPGWLSVGDSFPGIFLGQEVVWHVFVQTDWLLLHTLSYYYEYNTAVCRRYCLVPGMQHV